jgi:uncharacterized protein
MPQALVTILHAVLEDYHLPLDGDHGVAHWARVLENGLRLAENTGADVEVVRLFAIFHDCRRVNEFNDPEHGPRAAALAVERQADWLPHLSSAQLRLLQRACEGHTHERFHPDATIQTCWDADRLDLGRVGTTPHPDYLGTECARRPDILAWANRRGMRAVVPEFVREVWGIDLNSIR